MNKKCICLPTKSITVLRFIVVRHMDLEDVIQNDMYMHLEVMFFYTKTFFVQYAFEFGTRSHST